MDKSPDAFRTISEVAELLETPAHVLRFWESRFPQIRPVKRAGGRRYYRPSDVTLLIGIKQLLHEDGLTIRGVQKILREQGVKFVSTLGPQNRPAPAPEAPFVEVTEEIADETPAPAANAPVPLFPDRAPPGKQVSVLDDTITAPSDVVAQPLRDIPAPVADQPAPAEAAKIRQRDFWDETASESPTQSPAPPPASGPRLRYVEARPEAVAPAPVATPQQDAPTIPAQPPHAVTAEAESPRSAPPAEPATMPADGPSALAETPPRWLAADLRALGPGAFRKVNPEHASALAARLRSLRGKLDERGRIAHR